MKYLTKNKYWNIVEDYDINQRLYLLIDRPNEIGTHKNFIYYFWKNNKNDLHRDYDLPSVTWNGDMSWNIDGKSQQRKNNKPAIIWKDGRHLLKKIN